MAETPPPRTALGAARQRFVDALPRKGEELRASLALLSLDPSRGELLDELRRRLHALFASAQVFRIEPLASELRRAVDLVDAARRAEGTLHEPDLHLLRTLAAALPALAEGEVPAALREATTRAAVQDTTPGEAEAPEPIEPQRRPTRPAPPASAVPRPRPASATVKPLHEPSARPSAQVTAVLVLGSLEAQVRAQAALSEERFELLVASNAEDALRLARASAPDVVLAELERLQAPEDDFLARLRGDPLTDFVPVLAWVPEGSEEDPLQLREQGIDDVLSASAPPERLRSVLSRLAGSPLRIGPTAGLGDMTVERLAEQLAEELRRGLHQAAARGRDVQVPLGDGTEVLAPLWEAITRIREVVTSRSGGRTTFHDAPRRGGPALLPAGEGALSTALHRDVPLAGRRILVADDDPEIVWFFAELLAEEQAETLEARDGEEALSIARAEQPDLVLADILMPGLDGLQLARRLRLDPALAEVPLILLSWKEDFLQRMRELGAGASDYLRKEAGATHILERIRHALRPLARLEAQLRTGAEVRGRIEGLGVQRLLRTTAAIRPDARIIVRDAWNLFEGALRDGVLVDLTRTGADGSFARGEAALAALVAVTASRFTVSEAHTPVRPSIRRPLEELLREANEALATRLEAIGGRNLARIARLDLEDEALEAVRRASPPHVQRILDRLAAGTSPRALLLEGEASPAELESVLGDLVRRGAVSRILGSGETDLVADARERRSRAPSAPPPAEPAHVEMEAEPTPPDTGDVVRDASSPDDEEEDRTELEPPSRKVRSEPAPSPDGEEEERTELEPPTQQVRTEELRSAEDEAATERHDPVPEHSEPEQTERLDRSEAAEAAPSLGSWLLLVLVSAALGYGGWMALEAAGLVGPGRERPSEASEPSPRGPDHGNGAASHQAPGMVAPEPSGGKAMRGAPPSRTEATEDRTLETIPPDAGVVVGPNEALLVVQGPPGARVKVDGQEVGRAPLKRALPAGRRELVVEHGGRQMVRSLVLRAGTARILTLR